MKLLAIPTALAAAAFALVPAALGQAPADLPPAPPVAIEQAKPKPVQPGAPSPSAAHSEAVSDKVPAAKETGSALAAQPSPSPTAEASKNASPEASESTEYVYRSRVDEVNVVFTVTDRHGRFIKDLTQGDFQVLDDNKAATQIVSFSHETDLPLRVGLLIDVSNSIRGRFKFEQDAAIEFLDQIVRPKSDRAFVIGFDTTPELTADFTDDSEKLSQGVHILRPGGGTALYDAVYYACRDKLMKAPQSGPVRRAIVLLSDGDDNQSRVTREEAIAMAQRAEVVIYAISTNASGYKERGDKVLERMADATGGRAFFPLRIQDVATAFAEIQDELRSQYAVAYRPAEFSRDGRYHSIQILAQNRKNLKVRARKGYFAPKQ
jgi:VWFA-related protein